MDCARDVYGFEVKHEAEVLEPEPDLPSRLLSSKFIKFATPEKDEHLDAEHLDADDARPVAVGLDLDRGLVLRTLLAMTNPFVVDPDIDAMLAKPEEYRDQLLPFGIDLRKFCGDFPRLDPSEFDVHFEPGAMAETVKALTAKKQRHDREKLNRASRYCQACGALAVVEQNTRKLCADCARVPCCDPNQGLLSVSYEDPTWRLRRYQRGRLAVDAVLCAVFRTPLAFQQISASRFVVVDQVRDQVYLRDVVSTKSQWFANYEIVPVLDVRGVLMVASTCIFFSHAMPSVVRPMVSPYNQMVLHVADLRDFTVTAFQDSVVLVGGHEPDLVCSSDVYRYDWGSQDWRELPGLSVGLCRHAATVSDGCLWVCGGVQATVARNNPPASASVWSFDGAAWTSRGELNVARIRPRFVVDAQRGLLTVVGGRDDDGRQIRVCEAFVGRRWTMLPEPMDECLDML